MSALSRGPLGWLMYVVVVFITTAAVLSILGEDDALSSSIVLALVVGTFAWTTSKKRSAS